METLHDARWKGRQVELSSVALLPHPGLGGAGALFVEAASRLERGGLRGDGKARARGEGDAHDAQVQVLGDLEVLPVVARLDVGEDLQVERPVTEPQEMLPFENGAPLRRSIMPTSPSPHVTGAGSSGSAATSPALPSRTIASK